MKGIVEEQIEAIAQQVKTQSILQKEHLTLEEASAYLGISKSYLYKRTSKREIPFYRPGKKRIFFLKKELDDWILAAKEFAKFEALELIPSKAR